MLSLPKEESNVQTILVCRSLTTAQRAARALQRHGIFAAVAKAPQSANPGGCTYGVKIGNQNLITAAAILESEGIEILKTVDAAAPSRARRGENA